MVKIEDFSKPKYFDYGKVFLVLYYKGFSWKKELENEFNISNVIVTKALQILEENGFIIAKDFWSLDLDSQEAIKRLNAGYSYLLKNHPKIYTLSLEGKEEGSYILLDELEKKAKLHSSLAATIQFIKEKTIGYQILKNQFENIESSHFYRKRIDHQTGILYETPTKKKKEFEKSVKIALLELKQENLIGLSKKSQIESKKGSDLVMVNKGEIALNGGNSTQNSLNEIVYNGVKINQNELYDLEKKMNENIEKSKTKIGIDENKVNLEHANRINQLKDFLGIEENISKINEEERKLIAEILKMIKKKGWMDVFTVQRMCGSDAVFKNFLNIACEHNIFDDGEDFRISR